MSDDRRYPRHPLLGVGALIFEGDLILMAQRGKPPLMGMWSLPGGLVEVGESLENAVRREVREETGLEIQPLGVLEIFERIMRDAEGAAEYHYVLIDFLCASLGGDLCCGSDAADACWVARGELATYGLAQITVSVIEKAFEMRDAS